MAAGLLWTAFVVLLVLWLAGAFSSHITGGLVHVLLALAVLALVVQLITRRTHPA